MSEGIPWKDRDCFIIDLQNHEGALCFNWPKNPNLPLKNCDKVHVDKALPTDDKNQCGGVFKVVLVSKVRKVLFCQNCGLRISFPATIKDAAGLKKYLRSVEIPV